MSKMDEEKYYVPELWEFHQGFEYEIYEDWDIHPTKEWHSQVYGKDGTNPESLGYIDESKIILEMVRVKKLDRKDIESLCGFTLDAGGIYQNYRTQFGEKTIELRLHVATRVVAITHVKTNGETIAPAILYYSCCPCMNKTELARTLIKMGIL